MTLFPVSSTRRRVDTATGAQHVVTLFSDVILMMMMIVIYTAAAAAYDDDVIEEEEEDEEEVDVDDDEEKVDEFLTINIADDKPVFTGLPDTLSPARADGLLTGRHFARSASRTPTTRAPQDSFFNVVPGTAPTFAIWVKAGVKLDAATSPLLVNVQCVDDRSPANIITETFTVPLLDKPPTFVTGIPGTSPSISDSTVTATSLGVFTVTDPDTTCSITSSLTSVYEIRPVTSPADLQKPEFQVWVSAAVTQASIDFNDQAVPLPLTITCTDGNTAITGTFNVNIVDEVAESTGFAGTSGDRNGYKRRFADGRHNPPHVQRDRQR
ncbi:hypothetical protein DPMN_002982 [Dreissena polymorpha]|uniref:Uncharacterized protein n=1 Tax=Dreissena polymorpha TaxID=45954 RepID=A0A9D4MML8_DREPO|nr:hypothetical protein DPMN_002982 [Dreissena polymorpha]